MWQTQHSPECVSVIVPRQPSPLPTPHQRESQDVVEGGEEHDMAAVAAAQNVRLLCELQRVGTAINEEYAPYAFCSVCSFPFLTNETGTCCNTKGLSKTCRRYYCQREWFCKVPSYPKHMYDAWVCTLCGNFSCEKHGHVCQHGGCTQLLCSGCEQLCSNCKQSFCVHHLKVNAGSMSQLCHECVQRMITKKLKR